MAISTIAITQGAGTNITVDTSTNGDMQVIKLAESTLGSNNLVPASASTGLLVNLGTVSAASIPVTNVSGQNLNVAVVGSVTVAGTVSISGNPAVAQSGTWNIGTVATITNTVTVAGTVAISGNPAVAQSGTWNIGTVASITNTVTVAGTVAISGTPTVQGTVTGNQGTAAAVSAAWPVKITDATNTSALQSVGGVYCLPVKVLAQAGGGYSQQDKTAFTEGTTNADVAGGVYNDAFAGSPAAGQSSCVRITAARAFHTNLRRNDGTEIGVAATPLVVGPAGTAMADNIAQVGGAAVVSAAAGVQKVGVSDGGGNAFSAANPLPVSNAPSSGFWKTHFTYGASASDVAIHTPAGGKTVYVEGLIITPTAAGALLKIYDNSNADANAIYVGQPPLGSIVITPARPIPLAAANNVLRYATGTAAAGDVVAWGYEA